MNGRRVHQFVSLCKKVVKKMALRSVGVMLMLAAVVYSAGCGGGFLGLQDYQRDILFSLGSLAFNLLSPGSAGPVGPAGETGPAGPTGEPGTVEPGGADGGGLACWDLNGNGITDPEEDTNGDEEVNVLDCQGPAGTDGSDGVDGVDGADGADGAAGATGSTGSEGSAGADGPTGPLGEAGPTLFNTFVDQFATVGVEGSYDLLRLESGESLPVVAIIEPALGCNDVDVLGYKVAISTRYTPANPVTMTLYFFREGPKTEGCFMFSLLAARASHASTVAQYGQERFIRPQVPANPDPDGILLVIDLPLNTLAGLGFPPVLQPQDLLAFELNSVEGFGDGGCYTLVGVDFFESEGSASIAHADVFETSDVSCAECINDGECNDEDPCTIDTCGEGECFHAALDCADENPCTIDECVEGECISTAMDCDDQDVCTIDDCQAGECVNMPVSCDDGMACTTDSCDSVEGCMHDDVVCPEGEVCQDGECVVPPECEEGDACDDENACTDDACVDGSCVNAPISCDDSDPCTQDTCDATAGCMYEAVDCSDGVGCTVDECIDGECQHTANDALCDDFINCTDDVCDMVNDCQITPDDTLCNDGLPCNGQEICAPNDVNMPEGCQSGAPPSPCCEANEDCQDDNPCTTGACDVQTGICEFVTDDTDTDGDGVPDCMDECPDTENPGGIVDLLPECPATSGIVNEVDAMGCSIVDRFDHCVETCACQNLGQPSGQFQSCLRGSCSDLLQALGVIQNNGQFASCTGGMIAEDFLPEEGCP